MSENLITPKMTALTGCLSTELAAAGLKMCSVAWVPGGPDLTQVGVNGGIGWVTINDITVISADGYANCDLGWAVDVTVGVAVCYPVKPEGIALTPMEYLTASTDLLTGMKAAQRAITCCDWGAKRKGLIVNGWTPGEPSGGAITGVWNLTLEL